MSTIPLKWIIVAGIVVVALLAFVGASFLRRRKQSGRLQQRFGPEYDRTVSELGGRTKAETELKAREERVEDLSITALAPAEAARFSDAWNALQGRFIDNPTGVVVQADELVRELMLKRGLTTLDELTLARRCASELSGGKGLFSTNGRWEGTYGALDASVTPIPRGSRRY